MGKHIFQYQSQSRIYYTIPAECRNVIMDGLYVCLLYMQGMPCATNLYTSVNKNPTGEDHHNEQYLSIYIHQSYHQNQLYLSIYTPINSSESLFLICVKTVHIDPIVTVRDQHDHNCAQ